MKRSPPLTLDLDAFSSALDAESDRACGVLGAAMLDARLEALFRRRLHAFTDELLGIGALGALSSRSKLARALGWIGEDVYADINTMRDIRNVFAHSADHRLSFAEPSIADRCRNLVIAKEFLDGIGDRVRNPGSRCSAEVFAGQQRMLSAPRKRFQLSVEFVAQYIDELGATSPQTGGIDLSAEVRRLGYDSEPRISGTATVRDPGL